MSVFHTPFAAACADVMAAATGLPASSFSVDAPPRRELGDFAVGCFAAAKAQQQNPAALASAIASKFEPNPWLQSATAAGPFVNFFVNRTAAFAYSIERGGHGTLLPAQGTGQTIVIDYSSPNISKHLAFHHIRSTVIGHSLAQIFRGLGYRVVGMNFLGDWGTTHGMLIAAYKKWGQQWSEPTSAPITVTALNDLYVRFRDEMKVDPQLENLGRAWFKKLEDGDPEARTLWQRFRDVSWAEFETVYKMLGIVFDEVRGESAYEPDMPGVLAELTAKGLVSDSQHAKVVELEGEKNPMLLVTKDGTTLYATRDFASAKYRWNTYQFTRSLYVVDRGQALHFRQLFKTLAKAGYPWASKCEHVPFGLVRIGGKKTSTRAGNVVLLKEVFQEATDEIADRIAQSQNNPDRTSEVSDVADTAQKVGIGAVMFANLMSQREKDVEFDWDKVMATDGDSGVYLQYAHARCASILRKSGVTDSIEPSDVELATLNSDGEWALARRMLDYADIVVRAANHCEPHVICHYLLELAGDFSRFYTAGNGDASLRVLCDDIPTRRARLALTSATKHVLGHGMALLGISAVAAV
jgi:arginyl-tRNA synthetase